MNIIRAYRDFAPLRFFGSLGLVSFVFGAASLIFLFIHWLDAGQFSPYKFVGFVGIYLISLALLVWTIGLMADMLDRLLGNQEKIIEMMKKQRYESRSEKKQD